MAKKQTITGAIREALKAEGLDASTDTVQSWAAAKYPKLKERIWGMSNPSARVSTVRRKLKEAPAKEPTQEEKKAYQKKRLKEATEQEKKRKQEAPAKEQEVNARIRQSLEQEQPEPDDLYRLGFQKALNLSKGAFPPISREEILATLDSDPRLLLKAYQQVASQGGDYRYCESIDCYIHADEWAKVAIPSDSHKQNKPL